MQRLYTLTVEAGVLALSGKFLRYYLLKRETSFHPHFPSQSAVSGVYLARLVRSDGEASWRQDNSPYGADIRCP